MVKKYAMTLVWRITQTGPILSIFFWSTALAGIFWPILGRSPDGPLWVFITATLGVGPDRATVVGLLLLFLLFAAVILAIGFLYDSVLKLWREQMDVTYERNPYVDDRLWRKERMMFEQFYLPLARAVHRAQPDAGLQEAIGRAEEWVATGVIRPTEHKKVP